MPEFRIQDVLGAMPKTMDEYEMMSAEEQAEYHAARGAREDVHRLVVFGHDHKTDRNNKPVEQGIGSPGRETKNSWAALLAAERRGDEAPGTTARLKAEAAKRAARG